MILELHEAGVEGTDQAQIRKDWRCYLEPPR